LAKAQKKKKCSILFNNRAKERRVRKGGRKDRIGIFIPALKKGANNIPVLRQVDSRTMKRGPTESGRKSNSNDRICILGGARH